MDYQEEEERQRHLARLFELDHCLLTSSENRVLVEYNRLLDWFRTHPDEDEPLLQACIEANRNACTGPVMKWEPETCDCGKQFVSLRAFAYHTRACEVVKAQRIPVAVTIGYRRTERFFLYLMCYRGRDPKTVERVTIGDTRSGYGSEDAARRAFHRLPALKGVALVESPEWSRLYQQCQEGILPSPHP